MNTGIMIPGPGEIKRYADLGSQIFLISDEYSTMDALKADLAAAYVGDVKEWNAEVTSLFTGADVILIHDNNVAGIEWAKAAARDLLKTVSSLSVIIWPYDFIEGGNVSVWLKQHKDQNAAVRSLLDLPRMAGKAFAEDALTKMQNNSARISSFVRSLVDYKDTTPPPPKPLIHGLLNRGRKAILSGPPKIGKSLNASQLAICISQGDVWHGFRCERSRVLYLNLEIDKDVFTRRLLEQFDALGIPKDHRLLENLETVNLRGNTPDLSQLVTQLSDYCKLRGNSYGAIFLDPVYKLINNGRDENSNSDVSGVGNLIDKLVESTGASVILIHHYAKGGGGSRAVEDRASGASSFGRDADAILTQTRLVLDSEHMSEGHGKKASRLEFSLREFASPDPVDLWLDYPIHIPDREDILNDCPLDGSKAAGLINSKTMVSADGQKRLFLDCIDRAPEAEDAPGYKNLSDVRSLTKWANATFAKYRKALEEDAAIETMQKGNRVVVKKV
ncbi:MAG: helicase RepA family protein [Erysipelotrichaceae bacterium]|nr:helicase RepA family protein [Erysipelotrichaceae bacterium]